MRIMLRATVPATLQRTRQLAEVTVLHARRLCDRTSAAAVIWPVVDRLNRVVESYPAASFATHIGSGLGTFGAAYVALSAIGFDAPSLAVAGVVTRLTKKLRTPPEMTLAAALAHAVPATNALKLGPLLVAPVSAVQTVPSEDLSRVERGIIAFTNRAQGPINTYGGPFLIVNWCVGLTSVATTTACVHAGLDVQQALAALPLVGAMSDAALDAASSGASCVAGAMLINTLAMPLRLYMLSLVGMDAFGAVAESHARFWRGYRSWLRKKLRAERAQKRASASRDGELKKTES